MGDRSIAAFVAALIVAAIPGAAFADNPNSPPGNPCSLNNGNPCNGNNGNLGQQGNAGHERVRIDKKPPPIDLAMPTVSGRGAFVSQIGDASTASIVQAAPNAYARADQDGSRQQVDIRQLGTGAAYAATTQLGNQNFARIEQSGSGRNVVRLTQNGTSNWAWSSQDALGTLHNAASLTQLGDNNDVRLVQDGNDNLALLTQEGDGNGMTAIQLGEGNRIIWTQQGNNLTDLQIIQTGGSEKNGQLQITQTGG